MSLLNNNTIETFTHLAEEHKQYAYGKLLSDEGADLETEKRKTAITVLHLAVSLEREDIVRLLIKAGADVTLTDKIYKLTPLHIAAYTGNEPIVKMLLDAGSDIYAADSKDWTPLMIMARYGHSDILINFFKNAKIIKSHSDHINGCLDVLKKNHHEAYDKFNDHIQSLLREDTLKRNDNSKAVVTGYEYDI